MDDLLYDFQISASDLSAIIVRGEPEIRRCWNSRQHSGFHRFARAEAASARLHKGRMTLLEARSLVRHWRLEAKNIVDARKRASLLENARGLDEYLDFMGSRQLALSRRRPYGVELKRMRIVARPPIQASAMSDPRWIWIDFSRGFELERQEQKALITALCGARSGIEMPEGCVEVVNPSNQRIALNGRLNPAAVASIERWCETVHSHWLQFAADEKRMSMSLQEAP